MSFRAATLVAFATWASGAAAQTDPSFANRPDTELFLLEVRLDGEALPDPLPSYAGSDGVLLPLGLFSEQLGLAIKVRPADGLAEGWALDENRRFLLHLGSQTASFDGRPVPLDRAMVEQHPDELYLDVRVLSALLPIDLAVDLRAAVLHVRPREKLPLQVQRERQRQLEASLRGAGSYEPHYPVLEVPYSLWKPPSVDQTVWIGTSRMPDGAYPPRLQYSTSASGELLFMQTELYAAGGIDELPSVRARASRSDPDGELLGPLQATHVAVGDIAPPDLDLISLSRFGPGFQLTNRPVSAPAHYDRHTFRGTLAPGWEVELHRNGLLIGYQRARADHQYEFADVLLLFGLNVFRLVFHGPQGQRREEQEVFNVGPGVVPVGKLFYRTSANLPELDVRRAVTADKRRASLEIDYGLLENLSTGIALALIGSDGRDRFYGKASLNGFWKWFSGTADLAAEATGGIAAQGQLRAQAGRVVASAQHAELFGYRSERFDIGVPLRRRSTLRLDGSIAPATTALVPVMAQLRRDEPVDEAARTELSVGSGVQVRRLSLTQTLIWPMEGWSQLVPSTETLASAELGAIGLRGFARIFMRPAVLSQLSLQVESRRLGTYHLAGGVSWVGGDLQYQASAGKTEGIFALQLQGTYSQRAGAAASLALSIAFKHDEREGGWTVQARGAASSASASARVFLDENGNGRMDTGERPLENVRLAVNGADTAYVTNRHGVAELSSLAAHSRFDVGVNDRSLEDPYWRPKLAGYQIIPRPGRTATLELPIQSTGEVTGTVFARAGEEQTVLPGVVVELESESGAVVRTRSAYDGFYTAPELLPGRYRVRVAPDQLAAKGWSPPPAREIVILADGTVIDGLDFVVGAAGAPASSGEAVAAGPLRLPADPNQPFSIETADGPLQVRYTRVVRFPLASWAAGLPLSEEEIRGLDELGAAMTESKRNRLVIVSHAQTVGPPEGALKRAKKGAEALRRYLKAVQLIPTKRVTISVIPQEPQSEPLGYIELALVEPVEPQSSVTGATASLTQSFTIGAN